ncbi:hypothetical protein ACFL4G_12240 [Thermodesulfobacteriota bacterium]
MNQAEDCSKDASVLFSGGTDSTLAAVKMLGQHERVHLLTFNPGFIFFVENSRKHAAMLMKRYGEGRVIHRIEDIRDSIAKILFGDVRKDIPKYGFNMSALVCLGCRLSMHTRAIIYNLEQGIRNLADGSIRKQSTIPEQMESVIQRNRKFYLEEYGIRQFSPIYEEDRSDLELDYMGMTSKKKLKKEFILFDTQATCPFGVTADVYARIFYGRLMGDTRLQDAHVYLDEKHPLMRRFIRDHFESRGVDLGERIRRIRELDGDE